MIKSNRPPNEYSNPPYVPYLWVNTDTGETFICTDNTVNANVWVGHGESWSGVSPSLSDVVVDAMQADILYGPANYTGTLIDTGVQYNVEKITFVAKFNLNSIASGAAIFSSYNSASTSAHLGVRITPNVYIFIDDGTAWSNAIFADSVEVGVDYDLICEVDVKGGLTRVWLNGTYLGLKYGMKTSCNMYDTFKLGYDPTIGLASGTITDAYIIDGLASEKLSFMPQA